MKLLGRDIQGEVLWSKVQARLEARGLWPEPEPPSSEDEGVEPRVEPRGFNLSALEEHADSTRPLPLQTHRGGLGQAVVIAKWAFRKTCQVFINEALARQRLFNGHVRDTYAQLSAEVLRLRAEVEVLRAAQAASETAATAEAVPSKAKSRPKATPKSTPKSTSGAARTAKPSPSSNSPGRKDQGPPGKRRPRT